MSELFYSVSDEARVIINDVIKTLDYVVNDSRLSYPVNVDEGNGVNQFYFETREQHLQSMIEWAIDYIGGNIDIDGDENEDPINLYDRRQ
ncbi:type II toxin-antitoxin system antitoxin, TscA family [Staphylococcus equorum]|uniref:TscA family type II toxin-antitoxin system antitoxin n=1 Tax=Staphylococcus equorum TaxID=246432 RepID=UPI003CED7C09